MGTKIYRENYLPGYQYHSVRNNNEIPTNSNWSQFYGSKNIQNGQHCNKLSPDSVTSLFSGYGKEVVKQMMLTHEATFKHQVSELHRLYKIQKEIMNEIKRAELYNRQIDTPPSSTSLVHRGSYEHSQTTWRKSPLSMVDTHDLTLLESRPSKARKCLFDLHLTAENYIDLEEEAIVVTENKMSGIFNNSCKRNNKADSGNGVSIDFRVQLFDLNEPFRDDDMDDTSRSNLSQKSHNGREQISCTKGAGLQGESPVDTQLIFSNDNNPENANGPTFSHTRNFKLPISDGIPSTENKVGSIDINLMYEFDAEVAERGNEKKATHVSGHIDLNLCASDEETSVPSCAPTSCDIENIELEINLDEKDTSTFHKDKLRDEDDTCAAMALVEIFSFINIDHFEENTSDPSEDTLFWFSKIASSHSESVERDLRIVSKEIDEFEAMTLSLLDLKEEEYMPKPFIFDNLELEKEPIPLVSRARRGRKKRDFQRDILPGMTSLSRHEVAEDVHTFGRIMKAMGHSLVKKNGGGGRRGRPRLVAEVTTLVDPKVTCKPLMEHISSVEIGLEERVLTGWGEIPRRPRRRRCHVGNLSSGAFS